MSHENIVKINILDESNIGRKTAVTDGGTWVKTKHRQDRQM